MTIEVWPVRLGPILEPLPVVQKTEDEMVFGKLMSALDFIHMFSDIKHDERADRWQKTVGLTAIRGLSAESKALLNFPETVTLFAEFDYSDERRFGVRNGTKGILFVLNKDSKKHQPYLERRVGQGNASQWVKEEQLNIPVSDGFILLQGEIEDLYRRSGSS